MLQGKNLPQVGVEQNSKDPCFYGTSDDADNECPQFCPHSNYFEQILTTELLRSVLSISGSVDSENQVGGKMSIEEVSTDYPSIVATIHDV